MILFLVIIGLIISLIAEIFRYYRVKANAFTREEVRLSAREQAQKLTYEDPVISCDYCGARIDTRKYKTCPQCGGAYDKDIEWIVRHDVKDEFVDKSTFEVISEREKKAQEECHKSLARIKTKITVLVVLILGLIGTLVVGILWIRSDEFKKNEKLNSGSYEHFVPADYTVVGDGTLIDKDGLKISVTGFYPEDRLSSYGDVTPYCDVKVAFHVENKTGKNIRLSIKCDTMNGVSSDSSKIFIYDYVGKGADITFYEKIINVDYGKISQLTFDKVEAYSEDRKYNYSSEEPVTINTTCDYVREFDFSKYNSIFSNDLVDIYSIPDLNSGNKQVYRILLINKSKELLTLSAGDARVDGQTVNTYSFSNSEVMPEGIFLSSDIRSYDDKFSYATSDTDITLSISVTCENDPTLDFSTGYIKIN